MLKIKKTAKGTLVMKKNQRITLRYAIGVISPARAVIWGTPSPKYNY